MKIVFLPGMDGTGELFEPVLNELTEYDCLVIPLSSTGQQDYDSLVEFVQSKLPDEECILVAESFSGPIGAKLMSVPLVKGVVFVATFLSSPAPVLLTLAQWLPLRWLSYMPGSKWVFQMMMFGHLASEKLLNQFQKIIRALDSKTLKARLKTMKHMQLEVNEENKPALYLLPDKDRLVPKNKSHEFKTYFSQLKIKTVKGPHFILQTCPEVAASMVAEFIEGVES